MSAAIGPLVRTPFSATFNAVERVLECIVDGARLEPAMDHAVRALLVAAGAVGVPVRRVHQLLEGLHVTFAEQVAGTLPAEHGARRIAPGRALIGLVAGEEVEEQRGLEERPALVLAERQDVAEQLLRRLPVEEVLLIGCALVGVARRNGDALDAQSLHLVEEGGRAPGIGIVEQRAIDGDAKTLGLGRLDGRNRPVVDARLADRLVVHLLVAVEMDRPVEVAIGLVAIDVFFQQQRIGADGHELAARDGAFDDLRQFLVQQRLAAGDDDDRGAAFVDRAEAVGQRQPLVEDLVGIVDLAAAGAGEIAPEQRFEHQDQRVFVAAAQLLPHDIGADLHRLQQGYAHTGPRERKRDDVAPQERPTSDGSRGFYAPRRPTEYQSSVIHDHAAGGPRKRTQTRDSLPSVGATCQIEQNAPKHRPRRIVVPCRNLATRMTLLAARRAGVSGRARA